MSAGFSHYRIGDDGRITASPSMAIGDHCAYLRELDGEIGLCVIEGAAFHHFSISELGLAHIVETGAHLLARLARARSADLAVTANAIGGMRE